MEVKSISAQNTQYLGQELGKSLKGGEVIALYGDLGSGKTVFTQGIAKGLGIKKRVVSPTFVFMRSYPLKKSGQNLVFYHLDLFRGQNEQDFSSLGLSEIFSQDSIVVLEWAEKISKILPKVRIDVTFVNVDENTRRITIKGSK